MLQLFGIKKDYPAGAGVVHALRGIDLSFRRSEFVSILGPSGCGKTTLLNIIGGLDGYTEGDLVINGVSTKEYKDRDWDTYRNHSVGFVFQTYNLIPHQTVLQNVELALTLSGVSKAERRERAARALEEVGLGDQLKKRPSEMSGGQMQRVAIARALVNEPDIILADEPTGALDTETSVQVMEILKKVSEKRLVVMVTHNPELADAYSTRIIRMLDGVIISDSSPLSDEEIATETARLAEEEALLMAEEEPSKKAKKAKKVKKPSMSFATSFMLSLKNLFTKKGRTTLTAFAGSIGIIGIALILSVSQGMTAYIDHVQETTLSAYPLTLESQTVDMTAMLESFMNQGSDIEHENDAVYKDPVIGEMVNALAKLELSKNDLAAFKTHLEAELAKPDSPLKEAISGIQYTYGIAPIVYTKNQNGDIIKSDTGELMMEMIGDFMIQAGTANSDLASSGSVTASPMMSGMMGMQMWQELLPGLADGDPINDMLEEQYDLVHGAWPNDKNEIVLVLNEKNELDDLTLYALGLLSREEIDAIIDAAASGTELPADNKKWSYEEICAMTFRAVMPYDRYKYSEADGIYVDVSENQNMLGVLYESAMELRVVGIIRPNEDAEVAMLSGAIGYTHLLTEHVVREAANSDVVKAQLASPTVDVLTGLPFETSTGSLTAAEKETRLRAYLADLKPSDARDVYISITALKAEADPVSGLDAQVNFVMAQMTDKDAVIAQISEMIAKEMEVDASMVAEQLSEMTLEELQQMLRPFIEESVKAEIRKQVEAGFASFDDAQVAAMLAAESPSYTTEDCARYYDEVTEFSDATYEERLAEIGSVNLDTPASINLFATTFENKDVIVDTIARYNDTVDEAQKISYTDFLGIMMSSITTIINAITYVLIAFVAISLVVSSIMIGVITLISVQERTKEIGILRAIGASKRNVSSMFNAETMIVGFAAGLLGVLATYLLCIPINLILHALTDIAQLRAFLPLPAALILIGISVLLTLFAGIIPSRSAAKKDPVVALRTE
ncbi:MAG: ABC transporter ATP-binding protein/permease [Ruminococcaceae bacterium]|nr:ABC transporter ATP-binding protein/permease [Oscillospiraceae bacterium]